MRAPPRRSVRPAEIIDRDWLSLLGHPSHDTCGVVAPNEGIVIDEDVGLSEPLNGSNLGLERQIRSGRFRWVRAEDEEHA